jgi:hypothetical protein
MFLSWLICLFRLANQNHDETGTREATSAVQLFERLVTADTENSATCTSTGPASQSAGAESCTPD